MAKRNRLTDPAKIQQKGFNDQAQVMKNSDGGLSWKPLGAAGTRIRVGQATPIMLYNSTATDAFVKFGDNTVTAPAGAADGIPVLASSTVVHNSGEHSYVIASAGTVFAYTADPELFQE
jgi:hypothetical protein